MIRFLLDEIFSYALNESLSFDAESRTRYVLDPTTGSY